MSSEYQRIVNELCKLQQQIFRNQVPTLLINFNNHEDIPLAIQQLIQGLMQIQTKQFIKAIGQNIENAKNENYKMKMQNQELKKLIKNQQVQVTLIRQCIQELTNQRNCLSGELQDLKAKQQSLGQLINSSSIEIKIKEILKQNQYVKIQLTQRDQLIDMKNQQIKSHKQKQTFLNSQIKALENDNILFHRDLKQANNRIQVLTKQNAAICQNQYSFKQNLTSIMEAHHKQLTNLQTSLSEERKLVQQNGSQLQQKIRDNQILQQSLEREKRRYQLIEDEAKYLREQFENLNKVIIAFSEQKSHIQQHLSNTQKQLQQLHLTLLQTTQTHASQLNTLNQKLSQAQVKQKNLSELFTSQNQIHQQKIIKLKQQFEQYRINSSKQKIQQQNLHLCVLSQVRKQTDVLRSMMMDVQRENQIIKDQLKVERDKCQDYMLYLEENNQLRVELERMASFKHGYNGSSRATAFNKFLFQIMELSEVIHRLKQDNLQLRNIVIKSAESTRKWMNKQVNKLLCNVMERKISCQSCSHWEQYEKNKKQIIQGGQQSRKGIRSSKDLKILNQKYKLIREQNQKLGNRIQQIIQE